MSDANRPIVENGRTVSFEHVTIAPMDRKWLLSNQTVLVRNGRIAAIGPSNSVAVPQGALRLDGRNRYLIPGLGEAHADLPRPPTQPEALESALFLFVANGVTVVRGMQGHPSHIELRERTARGELLGPALFVAGPVLDDKLVPDKEAAERVVREQKSAGYDLVKVLDPPAEVYESIAKTAQEVGIPFGGHVPRGVGLRRAIHAGQRTVEHLDGYIEAAEMDDSPIQNCDPLIRARELPFHADEGKMAALAIDTEENGVWNCPTMALFETFFSRVRGEQLCTQREETKYVPKAWVDKWVRVKNRLLDTENSNVMGFAVNSAGAPKLLWLRKRMLAELHRTGAKIAFGTDSPQLFSVPGFSIHREMAVMRDAGLSPYEVLVTATRKVAELLNAKSEFGTVEIGKRADLVLLEANPFEDLANASSIAGVMIRGRWLPEPEIKERLARIAELHAAQR